MAQKYIAPEVEAAERSDAQKRAAVFLFETDIYLLKVLAMGPIPGVPQKDRDNVRIELKHTLEAVDKGLDPMAIRQNRTDTGYCAMEKEEGVRLDFLLSQLWKAGYVLEEFFWQDQNNKGPVNTFKFAKIPGKRPEDGIRLPPKAVEILTRMRFNNATVWCNLRDRQDGLGQFRLDTINVAKGRLTNEPSTWLARDGRGYCLAANAD